MSWTEAKQACEEMGGHLVTITSQEENDFVQSLHRGGSVQAWIGMSELDEIGNWKWVTGEPLEFTSWRGGEPSHGNNEEHCVSMYPDGGWNDAWEPGPYSYFCEWEF